MDSDLQLLPGLLCESFFLELLTLECVLHDYAKSLSNLLVQVRNFLTYLAVLHVMKLAS